MPDIPKRFYVYQLVDPRDGAPFYVGKGQGDRAWQHELRAQAGTAVGCFAKNQRIAAILAAGRRVEVRIVAEYEDEVDALDHEFRLVDASPALTNVMPGGEGPAADEPRERNKRRAVYERRRAVLLARHTVGDVTKLKLSDRHKAEVADWLERVRNSRVVAAPKPAEIRPKGRETRKRRHFSSVSKRREYRLSF